MALVSIKEAKDPYTQREKARNNEDSYKGEEGTETRLPINTSTLRYKI